MEQGGGAGESLFILLAEDEPQMRLSLDLVLRRAGHRVHASDSAAGLLRALDTFSPEERSQIDLLVTDINMPGRRGDELIRDLDGLGYKLPVIVITAYGTPEMDAFFEKRGNVCLLRKPFRPEALLKAVVAVAGGCA